MFKPRYHPRLPRYFDWMAWGCAVLIAAISLLGFLGKYHWKLDLLTNFRVQYVQLALIFAGISLWVRHKKCAAAFIGIAALNYAIIFPLYVGRHALPATNPIRAMLININAGNGNTKQVLGAIAKANPDILILEEVTPKWASELAPLNAIYPYRIAKPQNDCFGMMLVSRYPLENGWVVQIGKAGVPSIITEARFPQGEVSIIATHPVPPIGRKYAEMRNNQLAALPAIVKGRPYPVLLIGDLNTSPWSPYFMELLRNSGLKNSMKGFGFQPSWSGNNPLLRIPIDHMLHSPEITIHNRMIGGNVGSDHLPVIVDFTM